MFEFMDNICFWDTIGRVCVGIVILRILFSIVRGLYATFIAESLGLNANLTSFGKWAIVTGATDGIGKTYSFELAKRGMNIVLISRNLSKLQNVAVEIKEKYNRETMIIDVDFTSLDIYERIESELEKLEIGVLVNNVGMSTPYLDYFEKFNHKFLKDIISCNVASVTLMTRIVLPGMKERNKGMIINISSFASLVYAPLLAAYGSTKAFMTYFSKTLSSELKHTGVEVQCLCPCFIATKMTRIRHSSSAVPSSDIFVKGALAACGVERMSAGYYYHNIQIYLIEFAGKYLPNFLLEVFMTNVIMRMAKKI